MVAAPLGAAVNKHLSSSSRSSGESLSWRYISSSGRIGLSFNCSPDSRGGRRVQVARMGEEPGGRWTWGAEWVAQLVTANGQNYPRPLYRM